MSDRQEADKVVRSADIAENKRLELLSRTLESAWIRTPPHLARVLLLLAVAS